MHAKLINLGSCLLLSVAPAVLAEPIIPGLVSSELEPELQGQIAGGPIAGGQMEGGEEPKSKAGTLAMAVGKEGMAMRAGLAMRKSSG